MLKEDFKSLSDEELARQTQAGSFVAFEELVLRYEARILRFVVKCCQHEADAQDITQIAFVTAFRSIQQFDPGRSFSAWLFTIARRKFLDHRRQQRPTTDQIPETPDLRDPYAAMAQAEQGSDTWGWARRHLTEDQFQALWLHYQEEMSVREVAAALGRNFISVKVMIFRARQQLFRASRSGGTLPLLPIPALATVKNHPTQLIR